MMNKLLVISLVFCFANAFAQTSWVKYANNPVLTTGPSNWDIIAVGQPTVLFENDTIKMWYVGVGGDMKARICYATSTDGINWTKYNNGTPVLNVGSVGSWDSGWLDAPEVVKGANGYFLYYYGDTVQQSAEINSAYGVATSPDGIHWTKHVGNPILTKGTINSWEGKWIESPAVVYDTASATYKMWYNGVATSWMIKVGYATSPDGINWTKYANNPVVDVGTWGSFDDMWIGTPSVIIRNNAYEMWYTGFSSIGQFDTLKMGFATSPDGINWTKSSANPLFSTFTPPYNQNIDDGGPWAADVIFDADSNKYKMWFETSAGFLYAYAPRNTTGIDKTMEYAPLLSNIYVYPNPASDKVNINYSIAKDGAVTISLFNVLGEKVTDIVNNTQLKGNYNSDIDIHTLSSGVYTIKMTVDGNVIVKRLVISR